jgi:hypothetical protein
VVVKEPVIHAITVSVNPDDFSLGVDAYGFGAVAACGIDGRVGPTAIDEAYW